MKTTLRHLIAVAALFALTGCVSTNISTVKNLSAAGARVGYISVDDYCPTAATACEFRPGSVAAVADFQTS